MEWTESSSENVALWSTGDEPNKGTRNKGQGLGLEKVNTDTHAHLQRPLASQTCPDDAIS